MSTNIPKPKISLVGQTFGVLEVLSQDLELSQQYQKIYWKCRCNKCNNITSVRSDGIKRCPKNCKLCKYPNLLGKTFGRLTVIEKGKTDKNGHVYWICECECGNLKEIAGTALIEGKTLSCGCYHKEKTSALNFKDLTGRQFGRLTVLYQAEHSKAGYIKWHCKCSCGTELDVQANNLQTGHTISCGCVRSKGELLLRQLLSNMSISFQTEYTFLDLPKRRFDFVILNKENKIIQAIEFHGRQHYEWISTWHQTKEDFYKAQERDKQKEQYCSNHNIPLLIIPYWDYDILDEQYLQEKLIMPQLSEEAQEV